MQVQPYLFFDGRCAEAIEFYTKAVGAEVSAMMRYKESPDPAMCPPGSAEKIMHASFRIGQTTLLASDGQNQGRTTYQGFSLAILADGDEEAERLFAALGEGGQVQMPMSATFFASRFGVLSDRFGVSWMVLNPRHRR